MSQSYRPLAWFLRPIKYRHKLPFRCVPILAVIGPRFPLTVEFFSFFVARKMSLLLYQTFLQELTLAFVSVNLYLCLQYTLGVGKILYFLSRKISLAIQQHLARINAWEKLCTLKPPDLQVLYIIVLRDWDDFANHIVISPFVFIFRGEEEARR